MDYPIRAPGQVSSQLKSLRKARGLSQAQLGALLGVGQTRIARIERDPTAISVEQFLALLGALDAQMVLRAGPSAVPDAKAAKKAVEPEGRRPRRKRDPEETW